MTASFDREVGRIADILRAVNLLTWDARVMMPGAGVSARGSQIATLNSLARDLAASDSFAEAIRLAGQEPGLSPERRLALDEAERSAAVLRRIPAALVSEAATLKTKGQAVWAEARRNDDFAAFAPLLARTIAIQREMAEAIGYAEHPYDAMLGLYEPGLDWSRLQGLYGELKAGLLPLLASAPKDDPIPDFLKRSYPVNRQKKFAKAIAEKLGYDFGRGRLDETVHPFEISFDCTDVRITSRYRENWLPGGFFGVWHEVGHGLYEQGVAPELSRTIFTIDLVNLYAVGGTSFAAHESQSRLLENRVGRSRRFWELHMETLASYFPDELKGVSAEDMWRAVNAVRPSLIRVEADELTYDLHIILRSEIEAMLMAGEVAAEDLPRLWREKMRDYLGLDVPSDRMGVLQDVHWSSGMIGSFPTYTLGNIMASQFFEAAHRNADVETGINSGDYGPLGLWLNEQIHRHGRMKTPADLLRDTTGRDLDLAPYLRDLENKVRGLGTATFSGDERTKVVP